MQDLQEPTALCTQGELTAGLAAGPLFRAGSWAPGAKVGRSDGLPDFMELTG